MVKVIGLAIAVSVVAIAGLIVNEVGGTSKDISQPYTATYMYCGAWTYTKNGNICTFYNTGRETRVDTEVTGLFFNTTSYRVVR